MKILVLRAGQLSVGDRVAAEMANGALVFRKIANVSRPPDELNRRDHYVPSPMRHVMFEGGGEVVYHRKDRVLAVKS